jgi:hypothetical protein
MLRRDGDGGLRELDAADAIGRARLVLSVGELRFASPPNARCCVIYLTGLRLGACRISATGGDTSRCCGRAVMDRRLISIAVCAGLGAIVGVAVSDLVHTSHLIGNILAGLGGGCGALVGVLMTRRRGV